MAQQTTSFLSDIKKFEDTLAKDPRSFCFAPLSDLYRKHQLFEKAIDVAKTGCEMHPGYIGGFMALGRAYYENGQVEESMAVLEKVIQATPDNHLAQKLLCQLYLNTGDAASAVKTLQAILAAHPSDTESQALLDSLQQSGTSNVIPPGVVNISFFSADTSEIMDESTLEYELALDDAEVLEELVEELGEPADECSDDPGFEFSDEPAEKDPLKTATLAELYVSQGFLDAALTIYQDLLKVDPDNGEYRRRVAEIQQKLTADNGAEVNFADDASSNGEGIPEKPTFAPEQPAVSQDNDAVAKLESWLEHIKRRR